MIIKWYDACSIEVDEEIIKTMQVIKDGRELLVIKTTHGKLYKVYESVVAIITEEDDTGDKEMTFIPRSWIISPKRLKQKVEK